VKLLRLLLLYYAACFPDLKNVEITEKIKKRERVRGREKEALACLFCRAQI